jgi:dienelactone hydrolase
MKRLFLFLVLFIMVCFQVSGQTNPDNYTEPLKEVLQQVEAAYKVKLKYSDNLVRDKMVVNAFWRYRDAVESTLHLILGPFDLVFEETAPGEYEISTFQYHRREPSEGEKHLRLLQSLYNDLSSWEARREELRRCIQDNLGLNPWPEKSPLNPIFTVTRNHNGYSTENVAIEPLPGLFLCGTLYRPITGKGPFPAVLLAQGHFDRQRYEADHQLLAATLARMGAVVFNYDMFAKNESLLQFDPEDHRTAVAQTVQTWSSLRVVDFLASLPDVDAERIGMTGASGGGTQTFLAVALDQRIKVSVPAVMVSSWFYGGCTCESGMPVHRCGAPHTNNAEIAAIAAPRPMLLISIGNDWTATTPDVEFPYVQDIYRFYNKEDMIENAHFQAEFHDFGPSKRDAACRFLARHLGLDLKKVTGTNGNIETGSCTIEDAQTMNVFGENGEGLPGHAIMGMKELLEKYSFLPGGQK